MDFTPKRAAEADIFTVDYVDLLRPGETILSAVWTATTVDGVDAAANSIIQGASSVTGSQVSTRIAAGVPGVRYAPICTAQTSNGRALVLPEYGMGQLEVTL